MQVIAVPVHKKTQTAERGKELARPSTRAQAEPIDNIDYRSSKPRQVRLFQRRDAFAALDDLINIEALW